MPCFLVVRTPCRIQQHSCQTLPHTWQPHPGQRPPQAFAGVQIFQLLQPASDLAASISYTAVAHLQRLPHWCMDADLALHSSRLGSRPAALTVCLGSNAAHIYTLDLAASAEVRSSWACGLPSQHLCLHGCESLMASVARSAYLHALLSCCSATCERHLTTSTACVWTCTAG